MLVGQLAKLSSPLELTLWVGKHWLSYSSQLELTQFVDLGTLSSRPCQAPCRAGVGRIRTVRKFFSSLD